MTIQTSLPQLIIALEAHRPYDMLEMGHLASTLDFLRRTKQPFARTTLTGHITGSAIAIDESNQSALLIWHEKLERWLQPGGHCEPDDASAEAAARRELMEEAGLHPDQITLLNSAPFDVDVHPIPARGDEPQHLHYDIRYLYRVPREAVTVTQMEWRPLRDIARDNDKSRARFARKLLAQLQTV